MAYNNHFGANYVYQPYQDPMSQNVYGMPQEQLMMYRTSTLLPTPYAAAASWQAGNPDFNSNAGIEDIDFPMYEDREYALSNRSSDMSSPVQPASPGSDTSSQSEIRYFHCPEPVCEPKRYKSKRKADVQRHITNKHTKDPQFDCLLVNCPRKGTQAFNQSYHRDEHMRKSHGIELVPSESKKQKTQRSRGQSSTIARRQAGDKVYEGSPYYYQNP